MGPLLLLGMLTVPIFACWIFLGRGYAKSLRWTAFGYTAIMTCIPIIGRLGR